MRSSIVCAALALGVLGCPRPLLVTEPPPRLDSDGDGIDDEYDQCPNEAEVVNGVGDEDGCP